MVLVRLRSRLLWIVAASAPFALCPAVSAQAWHCHAASGHFDDHDGDVPPGTTEVDGEITISNADDLQGWNPTARLALVDGDQPTPECHCNGIVIRSYPDKPDYLTVLSATDGEEKALIRVPYGKPVAFGLTFARDGTLTLKVGGRAFVSHSPALRRNKLVSSCSSADVHFRVTIAAPVEKRSPDRCPFAAAEQWTAADVDRYCRAAPRPR